MNSLGHDFEPLLADEGEQTRKGWFGPISLTKKLNLAVLGNTLVLALVAIVMLTGTAYLAELGRDQTILASVEVRSNNAAIALVDAADALEEGETPSAGAALDLAYETMTDPIEFAGDKMPAHLAPVMHGFRDRIDGLRSEYRAAGADTDKVQGLSRKVRVLYKDLSTFAVDFHEEAAGEADKLFVGISQVLIGFIIMTAIGIAVSLIGARRIIRNIAGAIGAITDSMEKVARGNTAADIPGREREDEIGAMARALEVFRASSLELRDITDARARDAERQLEEQLKSQNAARQMRSEKSDMLEGLAQGFEVSVGEVIAAVSTASEQLQSTSQDMVALAESSAEQSGDAAGAMEKATANVTSAATATDEFALSISEISKQASASAGLARDASALVGTANARMVDLSQAADEIGEIAELIQTIAQRTNLLALNASIEAARGGEAGRGFAVVASEVKDLATQTSHATNSVAEKIAAMQGSTASSVSDLTSIVEQIDKLEQASVLIASAVDQQSLSGEALARNIETVADGSARVGVQLENLREASIATGSAASQVRDSASQLGSQADELRSKATRFIADVRRSSRDLDAVEVGNSGGA